MLTVLFQHLLHPGHHSTLQIALISDQYHLGLGPECTSSKQFNLQVAYHHKPYTIGGTSCNSSKSRSHPSIPVHPLSTPRAKVSEHYRSNCPQITQITRARHPTRGVQPICHLRYAAHTPPSYLRSWAITQATHMGARPVVKL